MRARDLPLPYNAVEILERNLPDRRGATALVTEDGTRTFGAMEAEVNCVGNALLRTGVRMGDTVALLVPDCIEWVATFFATIKVGGVALGLNTLLTPGEYRTMLRDSRARVLVVHADLLDRIDEIRTDLPHVERLIVIGDDSPAGSLTYREWIEGESAVLEVAPTHREDICTLNYSSGTTGEPKGIPHAHKDLPLCARLWGENVLGLAPEDRTFAVAKLFFTFGLGGNLIFPWSVGASSVLYAGTPREAKNVLEVVRRHRPTILFSAPTAYAATLAVPDFPSAYDLASLRLCVSAGEALPAPLWHAWKERTGLDIVDGIGSTENFHIFLSNRPDDIRPGSSGRPIDGYDLRLVDGEGNEVPDGEVGDLWVRGETASLAYLKRYDASRRTFRGEWLVTGDQYRRDADGYYWHAGRSDDMLKVGGIWVSPVEVESALIGHPAILECAVIGRDDDAGLTKPEAHVVLNPGFEPSEALANELIEHCRSEMADYKRPRWIAFSPELPKTATGKIQRFRLRD